MMPSCWKLSRRAKINFASPVPADGNPSDVGRHDEASGGKFVASFFALGDPLQSIIEGPRRPQLPDSAAGRALTSLAGLAAPAMLPRSVPRNGGALGAMKAGTCSQLPAREAGSES